MKIVTVYKNKSTGYCAYKFRGIIYPFKHSEPQLHTATEVASGTRYRAAQKPEMYEYTGKRYAIKE